MVQDGGVASDSAMASGIKKPVVNDDRVLDKAQKPLPKRGVVFCL